MERPSVLPLASTRFRLLTTTPDEAECVRRAQEGDRAAFGILVDRYWRPLRRWLIGFVGQEQLAEDMTQEAFVRAWVGLGQLRAGVAFRVWLFRIAHNCVVSQSRGARAKTPVTLGPEPASKQAGPLETLLERECQQNVAQALTGLGPGYRAAYLLWTEEGLPYAEIAQVLDITEATARWRVCKARQFLLKELKDYLDEALP